MQSNNISVDMEFQMINNSNDTNDTNDTNDINNNNSQIINNTDITPHPQPTNTSRLYRFCCRIFTTRSIDIRRTIISIIIRYKLRLFTFRVILFTILTVFSNVIEINKTCKPDLKLWLNVIVGRSIVRLILQYFIYALVNGIISNSLLDYTILYKLSEMFDVFGMVWFAVGNLLLFNGMSCRKYIPFSFYISFTYILMSYITIIIPFFLRVSLSLSPPSRNNENEIYQQFILIRNRNNINNDLQNDAIYNFVSNNPSFNSELNNVQNEFWKNWLQERNCHEMKYTDLIEKQNKTINLNEEAFCPICLLEYDDDNAVEYPICLHIFHSQCLHQWLHASGKKGSRNLSCPCCRST